MGSPPRLLRPGSWLLLALVVLPPSASCARKHLGKTLTEWNAALEHGSTEEQIEAAKAVGHFGPRAKSSIPILFKLNTYSRGYAVTQHFRVALRKIGGDVDRFLLEKLKDPAEDVRAHAACTISDIGVQSEENASTLLATLTVCVGDESWYVRKSALRALSMFGPRAEPAIPEIVRAMEDANGDVRLQAVITTCQILDLAARMGAVDFKDRAESAIPHLVNLVDDDYVAEHRVQDNPIRDWAILTLAEFGPKAAPAVPSLKKVLFESGPYSKECRIAAARALYRIDKPDHAYRDFVVQAVFDPDEGVRETAISNLRDLGEVDDLVLDEIIEAFLGERSMCAVAAQEFLRGYLVRHPDKVGRLRERMKSCDSKIAANLEAWLAELEGRAPDD